VVVFTPHFGGLATTSTAPAGHDSVVAPELDPVTSRHLEKMVDSLVGEFGEDVDRGQIEALMSDSVQRLAGEANTPEFLPVLGYRFTRERLQSLTRGTHDLSERGIDIVFVSLSGGGRGQLASALTRNHAQGRVEVHSAGSAAGTTTLDPAVRAVIEELDLDLEDAYARPVTREVLEAADVIVTMGKSIGQVDLPDGVRVEDWRVGDPVGATVEEARRVRDDIDYRVRALLDSLARRTADRQVDPPAPAGTA
jgi:arsenate reductase